MTSFSGVTFVLFCFVFVFMLSLKPQPFVQSSFDSQVYNQTNEFVYLRGNVNHNADLSIEVDRRIRKSWCSFRKYTLELYDQPSAPLELKIRMLRAEVLKKCCTATSRGARARATTTR